MSKILASRKTKELRTEAEIKDQKLNVGDFTASWKGRITVVNAEKSAVAKKVGIEADGEYAIKVR